MFFQATQKYFQKGLLTSKKPKSKQNDSRPLLVVFRLNSYDIPNIMHYIGVTVGQHKSFFFFSGLFVGTIHSTELFLYLNIPMAV